MASVSSDRRRLIFGDSMISGEREVIVRNAGAVGLDGCRTPSRPIGWDRSQAGMSDLQSGRAKALVGDRIVVTLVGRLAAGFGRAYTVKDLRHIIRFSEALPGREIVYALGPRLSRTH